MCARNRIQVADCKLHAFGSLLFSNSAAVVMRICAELSGLKSHRLMPASLDKRRRTVCPMPQPIHKACGICRHLYEEKFNGTVYRIEILDWS